MVRPEASSGVLYVVATPIGNLEDLSPRALKALTDARLIACEDTRVTRAMLSRYGIRTRLVSCHRFNEVKRVEKVLDVLGDGFSIALVTDGGTPAVSDPGAILIGRARDEGYRVVPVPGPSAITTLLSVSGFRTTPFTFIGFLPSRKAERRRTLEALRTESRTMLFFEAPHRILKMLDDAVEILGDRHAFLGREMTKIHEEFRNGTLSSILAALRAGTVRGEIALLVSGVGGPVPQVPCGDDQPPEPLPDAVRRLVARGWDRKEAMRRVARERGISRRTVYQAVIRDAGEDPE